MYVYVCVHVSMLHTVHTYYMHMYICVCVCMYVCMWFVSSVYVQIQTNNNDCPIFVTRKHFLRRGLSDSPVSVPGDSGDYIDYCISYMEVIQLSNSSPCRIWLYYSSSYDTTNHRK